MRKNKEPQLNLLNLMPRNKIARELEAIARLLDANPDILDLVYGNLVKYRRQDTGRNGMTAEQVLRGAILKQYRELTYEELAFHLEDSTAFRSFAKLDMGQYPCGSTLQDNLSAIGAETWEAVNRRSCGLRRNKILRKGAPCGWMPPWWKAISIIPPIPPCWRTASGSSSACSRPKPCSLNA
jgi:transposase, IS5 family